MKGATTAPTFELREMEIPVFHQLGQRTAFETQTQSS
jgi:hypothetical protein